MPFRGLFHNVENNLYNIKQVSELQIGYISPSLGTEGEWMAYRCFIYTFINWICYVFINPPQFNTLVTPIVLTELSLKDFLALNIEQ